MNKRAFKYLLFRIALLLVIGIPVLVVQPSQAAENEEVSQEAVPSGKVLSGPLQNPQQSEVEEASSDADLAYGAFQRGYYLTAFELALPRANLGDPAAQTLIAEMYDRGLGVARNRIEATQWYEIAAKSGNREAQFAFALRLLEGKFVEKDRTRAAVLLKTAADKGHVSANFNYAQYLIDSETGNRGFKAAFPYLKAAADGGVPEAYYALSKMYETGRGGLIPNSKVARNWLILAARNGIDTAQVELGIKLANGVGGEKDLVSAFAWMQRAAFGGNVIAQQRIARMYAEGIGTEANSIEAGKWYILAKRAGNSDLWLDDFVKSLSPSDLAKVLEAANRRRNP